MRVMKSAALLAAGTALAVSMPVYAQFGGLGSLKKVLEAATRQVPQPPTQPQPIPTQASTPAPQERGAQANNGYVTRTSNAAAPRPIEVQQVPLTAAAPPSAAEGVANVAAPNSPSGQKGINESSVKYKMVIYPIYDNVGRFSEGMAAVEVDGKWGFINKSGQIVIKPTFAYARSFNNGVAVVQMQGDDGSYGDYGAIKKDGSWYLEPRYTNLEDLNDGYMCAIGKGGGAFHENAEQQDAPIYQVGDSFYVLENCQSFSEGLAAISYSEDGEEIWIFINKSYQKVFSVTGKGSRPEPFSGGYAHIHRTNAPCYIVDKLGNKYLHNRPDIGWHPGRYPPYHPYGDTASAPREKFFPVEFPATKASESLKFINVDGSDAFEIPSNWKISQFVNGYMAVVVDGKVGFINESGKMAIEPKFDLYSPPGFDLADAPSVWGTADVRDHGAFSFHEGLAAVVLNGKFGYANANGDLIIPPLFDEALGFSEGYAAVYLNGKWGYVSLQ